MRAGVDLDEVRDRLINFYGGSELWAECEELNDIRALVEEVDRLRDRIAIYREALRAVVGAGYTQAPFPASQDYVPKTAIARVITVLEDGR